MTGRAAALAVVLLALAGGALAEGAFELAFRNGTLDGLSAGTRLAYDSSVITPEDGGEGGDVSVSVDLGTDGSAAIRMHDGDASRVLGRFDADVGNPLAMYFLERTIRSVASATGGSDFYLRNRIKDALRAPERVNDVQVDWQGTSIDAMEIVLAPFSADPNARRLGRYADLELRLVVGEDVPGWYHSLHAESGEGAFVSHLELTEVTQ